ncbi:uncharacterized protein Z520_04792 [Fonsecaea multimorphosa CBS 102226]|uniref:Major facilitator superfamily (MFS) profile domain-containing protein n=1 Tax=Fonsecaea multimorphosa CBS 102226 TaxID=1442371 RepID=A0A0D2IQG5_9EURO|nr:uncharacterized protein Z520_04792 [Fonsecaea multimorphosa CBS 102226]KIX99216.1 hypothetical protein Z520_04792 [Fonsecaea multimorphosa CBS 102226]OAL25913.1 hypothetical protein AYO22_04540 [Fonsecaea multimorphosa]
MNMKLNSSRTQNAISGGVLFFAVGIYAAVLNLGAGGGGVDAAHVNNIVAAVFYGVFGVTGTFGGSTLNTLGPRYTLMIGAFGYPFYVSGLWYFDYGPAKTSSEVYPIIGGAVVGFSAGLLWTVSNFIAFGYAPEHEKGTFFMIQNSLGGAGALVGAAVVLGVSLNDPTVHVTPQSVYATFLSLMMLGVGLAWFICKPEDVRHEGKPIAVFRHESWWNETKGIAMLFKDVRTLLVVPLLLNCEIPVTLQPTISAYWFNLRTRSLCVFIGAIFEILGFMSMRMILDTEKLSRKARAYLGFAYMFTTLLAAYAGELGWMYTRPSGTFTQTNGVDWTDPGFAGFFVIFQLFQLSVTSVPMFISWLVMTITNEPMRVGRYAGLLKGGTASGIAAFFGVAASGTVSLQHQSIAQFVAQVGSALPVLYYIGKYVTETNYEVEKDVVFIPTHEAEILHLALPADSPRSSHTPISEEVVTDKH